MKLGVQLRRELEEARQEASEQLQQSEERHEQQLAQAVQAAEEAGAAADGAMQAVEQWRRRCFPALETPLDTTSPRSMPSRHSTAA